MHIGTPALLTTNRALLLIVLINFSCVKTNKLHRHSFIKPIMGTKAKVVFYSYHSNKKARLIADKLFARAKQLNNTFSHYLLKSEAIKINKNAFKKPITTTSDMMKVLRYSQQIWQKTEGYFDITLPFLPTHLKQQFPSKLHKGFEYVKLNFENNNIFFKKKVFLNFSAIAKGYTSDELLKILKKHKINIASVDIGGEIALAEPPPKKEGWKVWLTDSYLKKIKPIYLKNTSLSTSGDYYISKQQSTSHVLSPLNNYSNEKHTVTVIAPTATQADALATAFKAMGLQKTKFFLTKNKNLSVIFIDEKNTPHYLGKSKNLTSQKTEK